MQTLTSLFISASTQTLGVLEKIGDAERATPAMPPFRQQSSPLCRPNQGEQRKHFTILRTNNPNLNLRLASASGPSTHLAHLESTRFIFPKTKLPSNRKDM
jgi:hypothetical protein